MRRYISEVLRSDLGRKMVLLTGPRQVGKTTLAKELMSGYQRPQYLNLKTAVTPPQPLDFRSAEAFWVVRCPQECI